MSNSELARSFELLADLLEIQGANRFRINSFRRSARILKDLVEDAAELDRDDRLAEVEGIGKGTLEKIREHLRTGSMVELAELTAHMPEGLPALLEVPGMGPKKVAAVWKQLDVGSLADLKQAIEAGRLQALPGFGVQSAKKIAQGIQFLERSGGRVPYGQALTLGEALAERVAAIPGVERVAIAGSLRRGCETIGDIDLLCTARDGGAVVQAFSALAEDGAVLAAGETKGSITIPLEQRRPVQVDLRVVPEESFGAALQYFSGSKAHNVRLRELAIRQGYKLNEWGLFDGAQQLAGAEEADIYQRLSLPLIPVELREDRGEFDADPAGFAALVTLPDIRGDLHLHTVASDGKCTVEDLAQAARARGYAYINITDHSRSSAIAGGLSIERMVAHIETVRRFDQSFDGLKILVGCECDILADGTLDYPDDLLAACDIVVASIHSATGQPAEVITRRTLAAIENPHVDIIGHPTSRLLDQRPANAVDIGEIARAAAATGTALEVNASWRRLDLKDLHIRQALDAGALICINTDAHRVEQLDAMRYGIVTARRGAAPRDRVLNTFGLERLLAAVKH